MTRREFLKRLEYLLQDMDEKDREDALEYYRDYLDDAGISDVDRVDGVLDSPERVAMSIRESLKGDRESWEQRPENEITYVEAEDEKRENKLGRYILIGILCILCLPLIGSLGAGVLGVLAGIIAVLAAIFFGVAVLAIALLIAGVAVFVMGIVHMAASMPEGVMMMGLALLLIALGVVCTLLSILIFTKLLPWFVRGVVGLFRKIFHRGGAMA